MSFLKSKDGTQIFFKDAGSGAPVILIHGWPLSADMFEDQTYRLLEEGYRVISYDRRGFGRSDQPAGGYDYNTFASDLNDLIEHLQLEQVSLVGFSMGAGEIARYVSRYGTTKVSCAALVSGVTPIVGKSEDNPVGVPEEKVDEIIAGIKKDRFAFFASFFKDFYGVGMLTHPVTEETLAWARSVTNMAGLKATINCVDAFAYTDFRPDMAAFTIPTLIIHGTADKTVPIATSGDQAAKLIPAAQYKKYEGAPHGLNITHKDQFNDDLVQFLAAHAPKVLSPLLSKKVASGEPIRAH